jgi:opacity protein-like surface antigen
MAFTYETGLGNTPKPYNGVPVAGVLLDATVFPLAMGHKRHDMLKNVGLSLMYDKVIKINSKQGTATLPTSQSHFAIGGVFRYPLGKATIGAQLRYGKQAFTIGSVGTVMSELPNVNYSIIDPGAFLRYEATPKVTLNVSLGYMAFLDTGAIQKNDAYGAATVTGFEGEIGADYALTKNIFARAAFRFETIGFKFKGTGSMSTMRDTDAEQDVFGARDNYLGGAVTVGYLY